MGTLLTYGFLSLNVIASDELYVCTMNERWQNVTQQQQFSGGRQDVSQPCVRCVRKVV